MQHIQTFSTLERPRIAARPAAAAAGVQARSGPGWGEGVRAMAAASALSFMFPVAILVIGTPLALAVRGIVELIEWLLA